MEAASSVPGLIWNTFRMPILNGIGFVITYLLNDDGVIDISDLPFKEIAVGIIAVKWLHSIGAELLRLWVATNDLGYIGDMMTAPSIANTIMNLEARTFTSMINSLFFLPFINQSHKREQLYQYLPSMLIWPLDNVLTILGIDLQYDLNMLGVTLTGLIGAIEPFNDVFMLMLVFLTDPRSFLGDLDFFKAVCGYIPLLLTAVAWASNELVMVYQDPYGLYKVSELLIDAQQFIYMVYPTVLVYIATFEQETVCDKWWCLIARWLNIQQ